VKKLALHPEALAVESFATVAGEDRRAGTVRAYDKTNDYATCLCSAAYDTPCCSVERPTCGGQATCLTSCNAGGPCTCPLP
jgi:hypothetical protein